MVQENSENRATNGRNQHIQRSINQNDIKHSVGLVSRKVTHNTLNIQFFPRCRHFEVADTIG